MPQYITFCPAVSFFFLWLHHATYRILVPRPGIEPQPLAVKARSPNHWTAREFPALQYLICAWLQLESASVSISKAMASASPLGQHSLACDYMYFHIIEFWLRLGALNSPFLVFNVMARPRRLVVGQLHQTLFWHSFLNSNCLFTYCFSFSIRLKKNPKKPSFIEIQFTHHTIHPFKVDNLVVFSTFTNYAANNVNSRTFSSPQKETLGSLPVPSRFSPSPQLLATTNLFVSMDLPILYILYRWNHVICGLLWLTSFT